MDWHTNWYNHWYNHYVILGPVPRIPVDGFEGKRLRERLCSTLRVDCRAGARRSDWVLEENVGLRLGQSFGRGRHVPIMVPAEEAHPERRCDAVHEAHDHTQNRLQQRLDER